MDWIKTSEALPKLHTTVEISEDGINVDGDANYTDKRHCMLAGVGGGNGYFNYPGFATTGSEGEDTGLILDPPNYWRELPADPTE